MTKADAVDVDVALWSEVRLKPDQAPTGLDRVFLLHVQYFKWLWFELKEQQYVVRVLLVSYASPGVLFWHHGSWLVLAASNLNTVRVK